MPSSHWELYLSVHTQKPCGLAVCMPASLHRNATYTNSTYSNASFVLQVQLMDEKSLRKMLNTFEKKVGWSAWLKYSLQSSLLHVFLTKAHVHAAALPSCHGTSSRALCCVCIQLPHHLVATQPPFELCMACPAPHECAGLAVCVGVCCARPGSSTLLQSSSWCNITACICSRVLLPGPAC
jgi:hypothetical protein